MKRITKYCQTKGITINELAQIVGVNINTIKLLDKNPRLNTTIKTIDSIFVGTLAKFGHPLEASDYLDWPFLQYKSFRRVEIAVNAGGSDQEVVLNEPQYISKDQVGKTSKLKK